MLDLLLAVGDLNRPRGLACLSTCLMPCPWLGPGVGEGVRGASWGGGEPRSPSHIWPPTYTRAHKLTSLAFLSLYLSSQLHSSLSVSLSPLYYLSQALSVSWSLLLLSLSFPFSFFLPLPSSLLMSILPPMVPLSTVLPCTPTHKPTHILYLLHCIFTTFSRFRYV